MMGILYLVPTPVGNFEDITMRALRILREADLILAEDTRTSGNLLRHFDIKNAMLSYHKFNEHQTVESVVNRLRGGETVAVVSDAGTPGISDPGFLVAREAIRAGIEVVTLPGATAMVPALVSSGLPCDRFCFEGFLPQKKEVFGAERPVSVCREISKIHEESVRGTLAEALEHFQTNEPRGEFVIVVGGYEENRQSEEKD